MLRLSTFCMLLAFAAAQSGYEYNKPGKPFNQGSTPNKNDYSPSPGGFQVPTTSSPYQYQGVKGDDYSISGGSTQNSPPSPGYPAGPNQGQQTQPGYSSLIPSSGLLFTGQDSIRPSNAFSGQTGSNYPGQEQNYLEQNQQNYPGQTGIPSQSSAPSRQNYPSQLGQSSGSPSQNQPGGQAYGGQPIGGPSPTGASGFRPSTQGLGQSIAGFGQANTGFGQANAGLSNDNTGAYEGGDYSAIPGEPNIDYPILTEVPPTSFRCDAQAYPGYYADVETRCQVFHICANNRTYDFLCPNGTIFSQQVFVCVWWNQFDCNSAPGLYELNANLYDYSKTGTTSQNAYQPGLNDYRQGQQGPSAYPASTPGLQGTSANYPGRTGTQSISSYPVDSGSPGYTGTPGYPGASGAQSSLTSSIGSQGASTGNQGSATPPSSFIESDPRSPSNSYLGPQGQYARSGSKSPSTSYTASGGQAPSTSYPESSQGQSYPGSSPQGPSSSYSGSSQGQSYPALSPQGTSSSYPGSSQGQSYPYPTSAPQGPSGSYPGSSLSSGSYSASVSQGPSGYPGSASTQGTSAPFPGSSVTPGFPSSGVPQSQTSKAPSSYSGSASRASLGYPSGKPSGPSFPTGGRPKQPNREYLPPRN